MHKRARVVTKIRFMTFSSVAGRALWRTSPGRSKNAVPKICVRADEILVQPHFGSFHLSEMTESAINRDRGTATATVLERLFEVNQPDVSPTAIDANINYVKRPCWL